MKTYAGLVVLLLLMACSQKRPVSPPLLLKNTDTLIAPSIYPIQPAVVTLLDTCPPPIVVKVAAIAGVASFQNGILHHLAPPVSKPADFIASFKNYNTEDGLAYSSLTAGCMDKNGTLWLGTSGGGISRYDGKSFLNYGFAQGLSETYITALLIDHKGTLWIGTWLGGICKYDGKSFSNFMPDHGLISNKVRSLYEDKSGNLWIGTSEGLSRYDGKIFSNFTVANGLPDNNIECIAQDAQGKLWFGTDKGISRFEGNTFTNYTTKDGLANDSIYSMLSDKAGNLWFGTRSGLSKLEAGKLDGFKNFTTAQGLPGNFIRTIFQDARGNLWLGTSEGASYYDGKNFTNYSVKQGLANQFVRTIVEDKSGDIWFGTGGGGISRYSGQAISSYTASQGLIDDRVATATEDSSHCLWFANGNGLSRYDGKNFTNYTAAQGLVSAAYKGILKDKKGDLWFGTATGICRYNGQSFTNYGAAQGLGKYPLLNDMTEDSEGNLWFGFDGGGCAMLDKARTSFTRYTYPGSLPFPNIRAVAEGKNGDMWFGSWGGGAFRLEKDRKTFTVFTDKQGLASDDVKAIMRDKNGNLWFASDFGLSRYDGRTMIRYRTGDGLPNDQLSDIVEDKNRMIWIGSKLGISTFNFSLKGSSKELVPADNALPNQELATNYQPVFDNYNYKKGYPIKDVNVQAMFVDSRNILWVGTGDKLVRFDYSKIHKDSLPPNVLLQNIKINNNNISWYNLQKNEEKIDSITTPPNVTEEVNIYGRELTTAQRDSVFEMFKDIRFDSITRFYPLPVNLALPYRFNNIAFDFAAIEPARPSLVRYQYMLEGYDEDWSPVTDNSTASFGNMHEGDYVFKLKAQNPDGIWSAPLAYNFTVLPPWYRSWWAYFLYLLAFATAALSFIKWREKKLIREKILLEEKVSVRTDELRKEKEKVESALSELEQTQAQLIQSEKMASLGELTAGIAHEIQNPLNFVNNFSEVSNELIDEMTDELNKGEIDEAKAIASDIKQNLEKINHHGKRADAIVKSMLQHTRSSSGIKNPTDINALADEYLRLAYHGLRAKDKSFNATLKTDFDKSIEKINIIPQDIGRVILNLITNAFYAVNEKKKQASEGYEPTVSVSTKNVAGKIEVRVKDNGNGIPSKALDKIFQPFFTTKPTGQGTGLGLSLSYDIIKAHGGELNVETKEGEGADFIIRLPAV